jgi:radical SAM superfamily enzyme YgiQ (UPF0313 family)
MWLCYAVGYLEKHGHEVLLIDAPATGVEIEEVLERTTGFGPRLAVIVSSTPSIYDDIETARRLKERNPGLFTVLVGAHVSALPKETLQEAPGVDAIAFGEYDATLVELAGLLEKDGNAANLATVAGLA